FHGRPDLLPRAEELVCDPTPAPEALRYEHLIRNDTYCTLARFTEALIRSRPGQLDGVRFDHGPAAEEGRSGRRQSSPPACDSTLHRSCGGSVPRRPMSTRSVARRS